MNEQKDCKQKKFIGLDTTGVKWISEDSSLMTTTNDGEDNASLCPK